MTRSKTTRPETSRTTWLAALLLASTAWAAPPEAVDAGWILERLARPAPMHTSFVEMRGSALLKAPLRIEGEYRRPDADTLVRVVRVPYVETTTIRAGEVAIARGDKSPRRFPLSRAPELQGLQASFGALLAGDRTQLERYYRIQAGGTRQQWTLALAPKDAALAAKLRDITLHGRGAELRCIETRPVKGDLQRTLLAGAARAAAPGADNATLAALCRGG